MTTRHVKTEQALLVAKRYEHLKGMPEVVHVIEVFDGPDEIAERLETIQMAAILDMPKGDRRMLLWWAHHCNELRIE